MSVSSPPARLLLLIGDFAGGGAERELSILAHHLPRDRFEIELAVLRSRFTHPVPPDVPVHVLGKERPWHLLRAVRNLRTVLDTTRTDVLFSTLLYPSLLAGQALRRSRAGTRWVARLTNPPEQQLRGLLGLWGRRVLPRADRILASSRGVASALEERLSLPAGVVTAIDNPVDIEGIVQAAKGPLPLERPSNTFLVVHAGRLHPQKDQDTLLRAFAAAGIEKSELWILGEGPEESRLRRRARSLGIDHQVRWLGYCDNPYPILHAADCFVLSSRWEGLPNVIIEAMACGTPVVSTRCRYGPDELIEDGKTGRLVDCGDWRAMASVLCRWGQDAGERTEMAERARTVTFGRFQISRAVEGFARVFSTPES